MVVYSRKQCIAISLVKKKQQQKKTKSKMAEMAISKSRSTENE